MSNGRVVGTEDARGRERARYQQFNDEPSRTVQSDAKGADIQEILRKYQLGIVDDLNYTEQTFRDISEFTDYADVMRNVAMAEVEFMKLPSKVREIFAHDVTNWLDAAHDEDKRDLLVEAGFLPKPEVPPEPPLEPVVPPEPSD